MSYLFKIILTIFKFLKFYPAIVLITKYTFATAAITKNTGGLSGKAKLAVQKCAQQQSNCNYL
jgi:hypothetical protein